MFDVGRQVKGAWRPGWIVGKPLIVFQVVAW